MVNAGLQGPHHGSWTLMSLNPSAICQLMCMHRCQIERTLQIVNKDRAAKACLIATTVSYQGLCMAYMLSLPSRKVRETMRAMKSIALPSQLLHGQ